MFVNSLSVYILTCVYRDATATHVEKTLRQLVFFKMAGVLAGFTVG